MWIPLFILAIVQGLTELLPVSSSGHLVVGQSLLVQLGMTKPLTHSQMLVIEVALHAGTLGAVLLFYHRRIVRLVRSDWRLAGLLVVATIPIAIIGLLMKKYGDGLLQSPLLAGVMLLVTATFLLASRRIGETDKPAGKLSVWQAILIGLAQSAAILPGISRSGATIVTGLACGLRRDEAAAFSFLLSIPAILGATIVTLPELASAEVRQAVPLIPLIAAAVVSMLVGLFALWWLVRWLEKGKLHQFAWYLYPVGAAVIVWQVVAMSAGG